MRFASLVLLLLLPQDAKLDWTDEEVGDGVVWRKATPTGQVIHVLEIDGAKKGVRTSLVRGLGVKKVSEIAGGTDAIAAISGGPFDSSGNPQGFLRADGKKMKAATSGQGCIGFTKEGKVAFKRLAEDADWGEVEHAVGGGAVLLEGGKEAGDLDDDGRRARSAAGITARDRVVFAVIEGGTKQTAGFTLPELARFMKSLSCMTAIALDAGEHPTLWVRGKPGDGVVGGTGKPVANAIVVHAKDVIVFDDAGPQFQCNPKNVWMRDGRSTPGAGGRATMTKPADSKAHLNDFMFVKEALGAEAMWKLEVEFGGDYDVFVRWPEGAYTTNAVFQLTAGIDQTEFKADQSKDGGKWIKIGKATLGKGGPAQRVVLTGTDMKPLAADAVKVVQR